uniref:Uncharacterized protein n=1 Tax=Meloidogyne incognita TaxID=6306 RepID=A0A914M4R7_MELIC
MEKKEIQQIKSSGNSTSCSSAVSELFSRQKRLLINSGGGGEGTIGGRFLTMSGSGGSRGAQEQLSPLPPINKIGCVQNSLSVSAYSADLSSDSSGLCRKNFALNNQINNQPKLTESEVLFDEEWELENCEKDLNNSNFNHRRKMERRADEQQQFLRLSNSLTSGTSLSVGSSSASRTSNKYK